MFERQISDKVDELSALREHGADTLGERYDKILELSALNFLGGHFGFGIQLLGLAIRTKQTELYRNLVGYAQSKEPAIINSIDAATDKTISFFESHPEIAKGVYDSISLLRRGL